MSGAGKMMATRFKIASKIPKLLNLPIDALPNGGARVPLPGISYEVLLRTGIPAPWSILQMMDLFRVIKHVSKEDFFFTDHNPNTTGVIAAQRLHLTQQFYEQAAFDFPMDLLIEPNHLSQRSVSALTSLVQRGEESCNSLVSCIRQFVFVDKDTRKVTNVPEDMHQRFPVLKNREALRVNPLECPDNHYKCMVQPQHSDTDLLDHINQSMYLRYCLDCAAGATQAGYFAHFKKDIFEYEVRHVDLLHRREGFVGDTFDICVWEDKEKEDLLHFQIKNGETYVLFSSISFHTRKNGF